MRCELLLQQDSGRHAGGSRGVPLAGGARQVGWQNIESFFIWVIYPIYLPVKLMIPQIAKCMFVRFATLGLI